MNLKTMRGAEMVRAIDGGNGVAAADNGEVEASEATRGLPVPRVFSEEGVSPFDQVEWEERTAEIKDGKGNVVFKQDGCEVPKAWSQLATNVVASKYFYGDVTAGNGSPAEGKREYSVAQLVGRVARTISYWGWKDGYFATALDAERFHDELAALCLGQYGAFNSPVWFNVGLDRYGVQGDYEGCRWSKELGHAVPVEPGQAYRHPQAGACFIVGVEDSIASIYERATVEGRIFKYGSGSGSNNSTIRSARELVRGGGKPSGPLSFMMVYDAVAKVTKSGGVSRRAAKMEILDDWHPDILEFVVCKQAEEAKAHALIREGYPADYNGEAYGTVCFQNSNMSVRFSDAFMAKVAGDDPDGTWRTRAVTTGTHRNANGAEMPVYDADEVFTAVAEGTWRCGDPGVQFSDTINHWNTVKEFGPILGSNPCSEFLMPNDTSCNLASLNLMKFRTPEGGFDVKRFAAAVRIFIIAQEILVDRAGYPTEAICRNSHDLRPLGLGYANLGALLMSCGLPYDSDAARKVAGLVTAVMHGEANLASAELASAMGAFPAYDANSRSMLDVMRMHQHAVGSLPAFDYPGSPPIAADLCYYVGPLWDRVVRTGESLGFRNAQVTLLAPTGTISFLMDCDTTGIEPELALVKHKALAGGGTLKLVNRTVEMALATLGFKESEAASVRDFIDANGTVEGAPGLAPHYLPVFDCSFPSGPSARSVHYLGHLRMMAAVQPFLSGAISKTCNMPESSTVDDIKAAYLEAWRLGLKCVAIYRDGSKGSQPLTTEKAEAKPEPVEVVPSKPSRERLPTTRRAITHKFEIQGHEGYINVGLYPDGRPGELFVTMAKEGSTVGGLMDVLGTSISIGLQYGVPLEVFVSKFSHVRFEPAGMSRNPDIPFAKSIADYIFRWIGMEFIDGYRQENAPKREMEAAIPAPAAARPVSLDDSPSCPDCGGVTRRSGSCYACTVCGSTTGCS